MLNKESDIKELEDMRNVLGDNAPKDIESLQNLKYYKAKEYKLIKLDAKRKNKLIEHPELKLPGAENAIADDRKFTEYLFGGKNESGLSKGKLITSKL